MEKKRQNIFLNTAGRFVFFTFDLNRKQRYFTFTGTISYIIKQVFRVKAAIRFKNLPGRLRKVIV